MLVYVWEEHWVWVCREGGGGLWELYVCLCAYVCVCRQARAARGGLGGQPDGDCRGKRERPLSGHPSASLYLMSVYQEVLHGGRGQWVYLPVPIPKTHPQHTLAEAFTSMRRGLIRTNGQHHHLKKELKLGHRILVSSGVEFFFFFFPLLIIRSYHRCTATARDLKPYKESKSWFLKRNEV